MSTFSLHLMPHDIQELVRDFIHGANDDWRGRFARVVGQLEVCYHCAMVPGEEGAIEECDRISSIMFQVLGTRPTLRRRRRRRRYFNHLAWQSWEGTSKRRF